MPKYFDSAASPTNKAEPASRQVVPVSMPSIHNTTDHTQNASIKTSHITVVLETM